MYPNESSLKVSTAIVYKLTLLYKAIDVRAGWDLNLWRTTPSPLMLIQQVAYGAAAAADHGKSDSAPRLEVQVDLLEEAFQYVADKNHVQQYKCLETEYGLPLKGLQFSIMRLLCVLYRQVCIYSCSSCTHILLLL